MPIPSDLPTHCDDYALQAFPIQTLPLPVLTSSVPRRRMEDYIEELRQKLIEADGGTEEFHIL